jgi:phage replication-related protein YjqB (UPF0714/DUF867 family)
MDGISGIIGVPAMKDKYANFGALAKAEKRGTGFRVRLRRRSAVTVVIAPHGGGIEPGTSEIAEAIAGADLSFYAFEGMKVRHNGHLHITSTNFDEPRCAALIAGSERVVAIHGQRREDDVVLPGGRDKARIQHLRESLRQSGFPVQNTRNPRLEGGDVANICNLGMQRAGVQIELSEGMRRTFFQSLGTRRGRQTRTQRFRDFVAAVRRVVA